MSLFSTRNKEKITQPWTWTWTPGDDLVNFFALYDSRGDVTISAPTSIATTLDGPIQVARYGALVVNAALTASQRCRGLMPIADTLNMGAAGSISMTGMGAAGSSKWAVGKDIFVPQSITFTGKNTSLAQFLAWIRQTGYCIFDPSMYASPLPGMGDVQCDWATWTPQGTAIVSATGGGAGGGALSAASSGVGVAGNVGGAGNSGGTGGGGSGGTFHSVVAGGTWGGNGGQGRVWGGGPGAGATYDAGSITVSLPADPYTGPGGAGNNYGGVVGGGAGNPGGAPGSGGGSAGGNGVGGILVVIVRGAVNLTAEHVISANGIAGGNATNCGGGGSGGGSASLIYLGVLTGTPNIIATGGAGGTGTYAGGAGGIGHAGNKTFATMGW
ncbi:MAG: hypothetical protein FD177_207 [Desulfovibrionaceae bacterium]|nr:MAG: hypothetical protein FD177_207 [Desulfovibrionaceae bacterium]